MKKKYRVKILMFSDKHVGYEIQEKKLFWYFTKKFSTGYYDYTCKCFIQSTFGQESLFRTLNEVDEALKWLKLDKRCTIGFEKSQSCLLYPTGREYRYAVADNLDDMKILKTCYEIETRQPKVVKVKYIDK